MRQYAEYNKAKADWLPDIPTHWGEQRIKTLFSLHDERNYLPLSEVNLISLYAKVGVIQHSDIEHTTGNRASNADGYKIVDKDDVIVNILLCWMGAIGRSDYNGVTSPAYDVYSPKEGVNSRYYHYLFRLPSFSQQCHRVGKGIMEMRWRTYSPQFCNIAVPVPPFQEQNQIVRFLDWKVSGVNKLINVKKREQKVLKEQIITLISKEFMKLDSFNGVRLSRCCTKIGSGKTPHGGATVYTTEGVLFIRSQNVYPSGVVIGGAYYISDAINEEMAGTKVLNGDVLLNITGGSIGRACVYELTIPANVNQHVCIIRPNMKLLDSKYLAYFLNSKLGQDLIWGNQNPGNRQSLTFPQIGSFCIPLPDVAQQREIIRKISTKIEKIENVAAILKKELELLQEYKIRLISDVVTGQIDVRNIVIPEYEYVKENSDDELVSADESEEPTDKEVS